jgi:hypothetical protein
VRRKSHGLKFCGAIVSLLQHGWSVKEEDREVRKPTEIRSTPMAKKTVDWTAEAAKMAKYVDKNMFEAHRGAFFGTNTT